MKKFIIENKDKQNFEELVKNLEPKTFRKQVKEILGNK